MRILYTFCNHKQIVMDECFFIMYQITNLKRQKGARWLSGRASDSGASGRGVRNLPPPCCVLEQDTLLPENTGNTKEAVAPSPHD